MLTTSVLVTVAGGCGSQTAGKDATSGEPAAESLPPLSDVSVDYQDQYGLSVWGSFTPDRDGTLVTATMVAAGRTMPAFSFPPSFDTDNWPPEPHPALRSGHLMRVLSDVLPSCDGDAHEPPVVTVTSRTLDGQVVENRFAVVRPGETAAQTQQWVDVVTDQFCSQRVVLEVTEASASADKQSATVTYLIRNPGPDEVTVTSRAWESGGARWLPASVTVPADGQGHRLSIQGVDGICDTEDPLVLGLMSAAGPDGERHDLTGDQSDGLESVCGR